MIAYSRNIQWEYWKQKGVLVLIHEQMLIYIFNRQAKFCLVIHF